MGEEPISDGYLFLNREEELQFLSEVSKEFTKFDRVLPGAVEKVKECVSVEAHLLQFCGHFHPCKCKMTEFEFLLFQVIEIGWPQILQDLQREAVQGNMFANEAIYLKQANFLTSMRHYVLNRAQFLNLNLFSGR